MKSLLGQIVDRAALVGKEIRCLDGWRVILDVEDGGRVVNFSLDDESIWTVGLWQSVEIRDVEK